MSGQYKAKVSQRKKTGKLKIVYYYVVEIAKLDQNIKQTHTLTANKKKTCTKIQLISAFKKLN